MRPKKYSWTKHHLTRLWRNPIRHLHELWLRWQYRMYDDDVCCCGDIVGSVGCSFHCCRSMKEYAITSRLEASHGKRV